MINQERMASRRSGGDDPKVPLSEIPERGTCYKPLAFQNNPISEGRFDIIESEIGALWRTTLIQCIL